MSRDKQHTTDNNRATAGTYTRTTYFCPAADPCTQANPRPWWWFVDVKFVVVFFLSFLSAEKNTAQNNSCVRCGPPSLLRSPWLSLIVLRVTPTCAVCVAGRIMADQAAAAEAHPKTKIILDYIAQHAFTEKLNTLVNKLCTVRPADPWDFLV